MGPAILGGFSMILGHHKVVIKGLIMKDVIKIIIEIIKTNGQVDREIIIIVRSKLTIKQPDKFLIIKLIPIRKAITYILIKIARRNKKLETTTMTPEKIFLNQKTARNKNRNITDSQNKIQTMTTKCLKTSQKKHQKKFFNKNNKLIKHHHMCIRIEILVISKKENSCFSVITEI